ncbi:septum formation initiator family protein [Geomonas sp. Red69]|uniref:FtsB family cell division protein n=1 Tax=Geomonas diazotrophica TaxID=2843197 RepID=UPI001C0FA6F9|nr:septum formation initiator family protein [Geomonas diazotrophica]MBU5637196.1 septum formation initiator family protein [Geomonas diazotrophica]
MQKRFFLVPAAVVIFILGFTVFGDRGLLRINHLHRDLDETQKRLNELKEENDKLKREIAALQSDRRYLESIARRDFGLVRSNEVIYQFSPGAAKPAAAGAPPQGGAQGAPATAPGTQGAAAGKPAQPAQPAGRSGR